MESEYLICPYWLNTNHPLFQIANIFLLLSYLIPGGPYAMLYLRFVIGAGSFFFALWGYVILCAFDTLVWNALFTLINLVDFCVIYRGFRPVAAFTDELETVFEDLFRPFGVTRHQFQSIAASVRETRKLVPREEFVLQKVTRNDNLSLVISGVLHTSGDGRRGELIKKYEFLESPEWFDVPENDFHEVSAVAAGKCTIVVWDRKFLKMAVSNDSFLRAALDDLVGKDVARKLNTLSESRSRLDVRQKSSSKGSIHRSKSADRGPPGVIRLPSPPLGWTSPKEIGTR